MSSKDYEEERVNHPKSDNLDWYLMVNHKENEVTKKPFQLIFSRYQTRLETSMKGSNFNCVVLCCITNVIKWILNAVDHI